MSGNAQVVNFFKSYTGNANVGSLMLPISGTAQHNSLAVFALQQSGDNIASVVGSVNGGYTPVDAIVSTILNYQLCTYFFEDIAGGAESLTATFSFSSTQYALFALELANVKLASFDGNIGAAAGGAVLAGNDTVSTGSGASSTNANAPAILVAMSFMNIATINPGTGFTGLGQFPGSPSVGGVYSFESKRITSLGAQAATFSPQANGTDALSLLMIFDEIAGGAGSNQGLTTTGAG